MHKKHSLDSKSWIILTLINSIKIRNRLARKYKRHPNEFNATTYKRFGNKLNGELKAAKHNYIVSQLDQAANPKSQWPIVRLLIGSKNDCNIGSILHEGRTISDPL